MEFINARPIDTPGIPEALALVPRIQAETRYGNSTGYVAEIQRGKVTEVVSPLSPLIYIQSRDQKIAAGAFEETGNRPPY